MPIPDPEERRAYYRAYMAKKRARGEAIWETPEKEAARKARWYQEKRSAENVTGLKKFTEKLTDAK